MARPKLKYKNKAEKEAALRQAREQYNRAYGSINEQRMGSDSELYSPYFDSQASAYMKQPKVAKLKRGGKAYFRESNNSGNHAVEQWQKRSNQLAIAYGNRISAIEKAGIAG